MPTPPEPAIARWFAHGVTSLTHPVLDYALETFLGPLGVEADWIEAEPFSALESGHGGWWLRNPRWNAARLDRLHPAAADFASLLEHPEWFSIGVDSQGILSLGVAAGAGRGAADYMRATEDGWTAIRHCVRAAQRVESFICGAAGVLLAGNAAAAAYASGDDGAFCAAVRGRLDGPDGASPGAATEPAKAAGAPTASRRGATGVPAA